MAFILKQTITIVRAIIIKGSLKIWISAITVLITLKKERKKKYMMRYFSPKTEQILYKKTMDT